MPPLDQQTCGRPPTTKRTYVWTVEINETMISAPDPLVLPPIALPYLDASTQHITILTNNGDSLQWNLIVNHHDFAQQCITNPWYQFLRNNNFSPGDEISFYFITFQNIWELVIRKQQQWDDRNSD
ncbi:hypothetical protein JHK82_043167 [Glycine max]|nr:hypothetical protein JHK82_043167 [Glycine max]